MACSWVVDVLLLRVAVKRVMFLFERNLIPIIYLDALYAKGGFKCFVVSNLMMYFNGVRQ
jgi:hypothetical protein